MDKGIKPNTGGRSNRCRPEQNPGRSIHEGKQVAGFVFPRCSNRDHQARKTGWPLSASSQGPISTPAA